ncbi:MAG: hypothetical protein JRG89_18705, partial [Deltaproteobacteria bacterium]|nr:hypothetical protein [Deltaproteobacteria bacterium]
MKYRNRKIQNLGCAVSQRATRLALSIGLASTLLAAGTALAAPTVDIVANPPSIPGGGSTFLTWTVTGATSCIASSAEDPAWFGAKLETGGSEEVIPFEDTTYTLTCTDGIDPVPASVVVPVGLPVGATVTANFSTIPLGGSVDIDWSSTSANTCVGTNFDTGDLTAGQDTVTPVAAGDVTYSLVCTGNGGAIGTNQATVSVVSAISVAVGSDFLTIPLGGSVDIDWSSTGANSCVGTNFDTSDLTVGVVTVTPIAEGAATYTADCIGDGGATGSGNVTVTVAPAISVTVGADFLTVPLGGSIDIDWSSTGANSC